MGKVAKSVQIVLAQHCNGYDTPRLFGGQLMAWIDVIGGVAAQRYAKSKVTTACVDHLEFVRAAHLGDTISQEAVVTWAGRTSMEVRVETYVERWGGERELCNRAYLVYVAIDEQDKPIPVPKFVPETEEEKAEYENAIKRREIRLGRSAG